MISSHNRPDERYAESQPKRKTSRLLSVFHGAAMVAVVQLLSACGGQNVEPLDARDATLPDDTRRWIAAVEDAVVVARARLGAAEDQLEQIERRREQRQEQMRFGGKGGALERALHRLGKARVALASLRVEHAAVVLDLARAKYRLANAERAILHDLARYNLEPLRQQLQRVRRELRNAREAVRVGSEAVEKATTEWWKAYAAYIAGKGDTRAFWIGTASPIRVADRTEKTGGEGKDSASASSSPSSRTGVKGKRIPTNPF